MLFVIEIFRKGIRLKVGTEFLEISLVEYYYVIFDILSNIAYKRSFSWYGVIQFTITGLEKNINQSRAFSSFN
ncbi:MAG: hypothetical protein H6605_11295 [Flavobacteriales bacterium]|nr:hypothetical protein [Flavobacteriales bacterium]